MAQVAGECVRRLADLLGGGAGLASAVALIAEREGLWLGEAGAERVVREQVSPELAEKTAGVQYPVFYVYCEKITNQLREKFRTFSGKARMAVEVRVSQEGIQELGRKTELYAEAVTDVLDRYRGDWGGGVFYGGGYEVVFGAVKRGGKGFVQAAKIGFDVEVSLG
ncbi:MAG: hypothetical protein ACUVXB_16185 [Bryobacteraceae bacterium]